MEKSSEIASLIKALSKVQGFGNRSAIRATLDLIANKDVKLTPLIKALCDVEQNITKCSVCGNFDTVNPCSICSDCRRDQGMLCIVDDISSLWAMERGDIYNGKYHITGGILSAINGIEPVDLNLAGLCERVKNENIKEVILALPATIDAKITSHYIINLLSGIDVKISELMQGIPIGGELNFLDEGTISAALQQRKLV